MALKFSRISFPVFLFFYARLNFPPIFLLCLQVDPQCLIQYIHWYHESESGEKRLLKTGRNATEPYVHVIDGVLAQDFGRYYCVIKNVVGQSECSAFLAIKNGQAAALHVAKPTKLGLLTALAAYITSCISAATTTTLPQL